MLIWGTKVNDFLNLEKQNHFLFWKVKNREEIP